MNLSYDLSSPEEGSFLSSEPVYKSEITVKRDYGTIRRAELPAKDEPITFGVHSEVADHYGVDTDEEPPHATTLDYLVSAAAG